MSKKTFRDIPDYLGSCRDLLMPGTVGLRYSLGVDSVDIRLDRDADKLVFVAVESGGNAKILHEITGEEIKSENYHRVFDEIRTKNGLT